MTYFYLLVNLLISPLFNNTHISKYNEIVYNKAINDSSTSQPFVLVTIVNDNNGQRKTGCLTVGTLRGALTFENGDSFSKSSYIKSQKTMAEHSNDRTFHLKAEKSLSTVGFADFESRDLDVCNILKEGKMVSISDRSGNILIAPD